MAVVHITLHPVAGLGFLKACREKLPVRTCYRCTDRVSRGGGEGEWRSEGRRLLDFLRRGSRVSCTMSVLGDSRKWGLVNFPGTMVGWGLSELDGRCGWRLEYRQLSRGPTRTHHTKFAELDGARRLTPQVTWDPWTEYGMQRRDMRDSSCTGA